MTDKVIGKCQHCGYEFMLLESNRLYWEGHDYYECPCGSAIVTKPVVSWFAKPAPTHTHTCPYCPHTVRDCNCDERNRDVYAHSDHGYCDLEPEVKNGPKG